MSEAQHLVDDAIFGFAPDKNEIDKVLFDGIVVQEEVPTSRAHYGSDSSLLSPPNKSGALILSAQTDFEHLYWDGDDNDEENGTESGSDHDSDYNVGGKMGFQTNIDDFLKKFDSFVDNEHLPINAHEFVLILGE